VNSKLSPDIKEMNSKLSADIKEVNSKLSADIKEVNNKIALIIVLLAIFATLEGMANYKDLAAFFK
jgi:hypothetical protein